MKLKINKKKTALLLFGFIALCTMSLLYIINFKKNDSRKNDNDTEQLAHVILYDKIQTLQSINKNSKNIYASPAMKIEHTYDYVYSYAYEPYVISEKYIAEVFKELHLKKVLENKSPPYRMILGTNENREEVRIGIDENTLTYTKDSVYSNKSFSPNAVESDYNRYINDPILVKLKIPINRYTFDKSSYYDFSSPEPIAVKHLVNATTIKFSYIAKHKDIPIVDKKLNITQNKLDIYVNSNNEIIKIDINFVGNVKQQLDKYKIKNVNDVINDINNGKAKFITSTASPGDDILYTNVYKGYISYYAIDSKLLPFYVLVGNSGTSYNKVNKSYVFLDATK